MRLKEGWKYFKNIFTVSGNTISVQENLLKLNTCLEVTDRNFVKDRNRMSQFYLGSEPRSVHVDFWENGMCWYSQWLKDIYTASLAVYLWNDLRMNSEDIEKQIPEIRFHVSRKMIEAGNQDYIQWHWANEVNNSRHRSNEEAELIQLLSKHPGVSKLMTFHQLWDFGLSRQIGNYGKYLNNDFLRATILDGTVTIRTHKQSAMYYGKGVDDYIGKGTPEEAFKLIIDHLPEGIDWAEYQTLEQYEQRAQAQPD